MKRLLDVGPLHTTALIRDAHVDGKYFVHTLHHDDAALERNKRIRLEGVGPARGRLGLHDGAQIIAHFQIPSFALWQRFGREHPDIFAQIFSKSDTEREQGARRLLQLHPEWSTAPANR